MENGSLENRAWKIRVDTNDEEMLSMLLKGNVILDYSVPGLVPGIDKDRVAEIIEPYYKGSSTKRLRAHVGQIFRALSQIRAGDLIIVPIDKGKLVSIGNVVSNNPVIRHTEISRQVNWISENLPVVNFEQDLQYSFMAIMKLCEVRRNKAFERLTVIASGEEDPGY